MESLEIIAAGAPSSVFDEWVDVLQKAGIRASQIPIVEYDRERGYSPNPHPRGKEVYVLVPVEELQAAIKLLQNYEA